MSRISMNVSGTSIEMDLKYLEREPYGRLAMMVKGAKNDGKGTNLVLDRPAESFTAIVTYYQTGELHIPTGVCPGSFKKELEYWDIGTDKLAECCLFRYYGFFEEQDALRKFRKTVLHHKNGDIDQTSPQVPVKCNSLLNVKRRAWNIIDNQESSVWSKMYFCGIFLLVLLSIFILAYGTEPLFQRKLTKCELIEYYKNSDHTIVEKIEKYLGYPDCSQNDYDDEVPFDGEYVYYYYYYDDDEETATENLSSETPSHVPVTPPSTSSATSTSESTSTSPSKPRHNKEKLRIPAFMIQNRVFDVLEKVTLGLFTLDFLLRILSCPSIPEYFRSVINIIDFIALLGTYVHVIVINVEKEQRYLENWLDIIIYVQVLRTFRLFRVVKNVRATKVLVYSVKQSIRELLILVMFLLIAVCTFASVVYFAEDRTMFQSIPNGWWWALITLTTVGYGDVYPKTPAGRVIGSLCAVTGVILISLTLPIFVNNFLTLYRYAEVDESLQNTTKAGKVLHRVESVQARDGMKTDHNATLITIEEIQEADIKQL